MPARLNLQTAYKVTDKGCWEWQHTKNWCGYGVFMLNRKKWRAHRYFYILVKGEIPKGLVLDHLCKNKSCVNPEHLEAVTQRENVLRWDASKNGEEQRVKTHCPKNHPYSGENLFIVIQKNGNPSRRCRTCVNARANRKRTARNAEKRAARMAGKNE